MGWNYEADFTSVSAVIIALCIGKKDELKYVRYCQGVY